MAKLRQNKAAAESSGMVTKVGIFAFIVGGLYFLFNNTTGLFDTSDSGGDYEEEPTADPIQNEEETYFLPTTNNGRVVLHDHYALSYDEEHEQAEWVAYELTRTQLNAQSIKRTNDFRPDDKVLTRSATPADYKRSGYDRGHLAPAGDMNFNRTAMSQSF